MSKPTVMTLVMISQIIFAAAASGLSVEVEVSSTPQMTHPKYTALSAVLASLQEKLAVVSNAMLFEELDDVNFEQRYETAVKQILAERAEAVQAQIFADLADLDFEAALSYILGLFSELNISSQLSGTLALPVKSLLESLAASLSGSFGAVEELQQLKGGRPGYILNSLKKFFEQLDELAEWDILTPSRAETGLEVFTGLLELLFNSPPEAFELPPTFYYDAVSELVNDFQTMWDSELEQLKKSLQTILEGYKRKIIPEEVKPEILQVSELPIEEKLGEGEKDQDPRLFARKQKKDQDEDEIEEIGRKKPQPAKKNQPESKIKPPTNIREPFGQKSTISKLNPQKTINKSSGVSKLGGASQTREPTSTIRRPANNPGLKIEKPKPRIQEEQEDEIESPSRVKLQMLRKNFEEIEVVTEADEVLIAELLKAEDDLGLGFVEMPEFSAQDQQLHTTDATLLEKLKQKDVGCENTKFYFPLNMVTFYVNRLIFRNNIFTSDMEKDIRDLRHNYSTADQNFSVVRQQLGSTLVSSVEQNFKAKATDKSFEEFSNFPLLINEAYLFMKNCLIEDVKRIFDGRLNAFVGSPEYIKLATSNLPKAKAEAYFKGNKDAVMKQLKDALFKEKVPPMAKYLEEFTVMQVVKRYARPADWTRMFEDIKEYILTSKEEAKNIQQISSKIEHFKIIKATLERRREIYLQNKPKQTE